MVQLKPYQTEASSETSPSTPLTTPMLLDSMKYQRAQPFDNHIRQKGGSDAHTHKDILVYFCNSRTFFPDMEFPGI